MNRLAIAIFQSVHFCESFVRKGKHPNSSLINTTKILLYYIFAFFLSFL